MAQENSFDPFFNVRKGGPKEKRIRRVELMGEHKPKPIYYIRVSQDIRDDFLSTEALKEYYESRFGVVADIYRPIDLVSMQKEFALIGFYDPELVTKIETEIDSKPIIVDEAKPWLLELYPKRDDV